MALKYKFRVIQTFQIHLTNCKNIFFRPKEFIECEEPIDHKGNKTAKEESGFGCVKVIYSLTGPKFQNFCSLRFK